MDKAMSKSILRANNIPVPEDVLIPPGEPLAKYTDAIGRMGFPLSGKAVVKPNSGGSSVGVSVAAGWEQLENAFNAVNALGDSVLIERFISGREITCGLVETRAGLKILPLLDIAAGDDASFYDYNAKYFSDATRIGASELPHFIRGMAERISEQAFNKLRCGGYARVDMIVRDEQVYVLEVNTLPGLTSHSLLPKAAGLAGWSYPELLDVIIENARK
jgi:D-alanine-D-alanine ligase